MLLKVYIVLINKTVKSFHMDVSLVLIWTVINYNFLSEGLVWERQWAQE